MFCERVQLKKHSLHLGLFSYLLWVTEQLYYKLRIASQSPPDKGDLGGFRR